MKGGEKKIKKSKLKFQNLGFTLIELLIVIALLGALAVGLLATVDPFEQLKKGTDTSTRNTASEVYNAAIRYYAVKNQFPWAGTELTGISLANVDFTDDPSGYLPMIINAGELKREFMELAGAGALNAIFVTSSAYAGTQNQIAVCFNPVSKSFSNDPNTQYNIDGNVTGGCVATDADGSEACFWCIK